jgi:hypothetical protein
VTEELGEAYVKGAIYEGLLERKAAEVKSGAGQYFTPRPLIDAIIEVVDPAPGKTVCDPACGTGKFLLQAYANMKPKARDRVSSARVRNETFTGYDVVPGVVRLAAMNLYLHGIGDSQSPVTRKDSLLADPGRKWHYVLTNPPFGRKQSFRVFTDDGDIETEREDYQRPDFAVTTSNKQLNFLQHVMTAYRRRTRSPPRSSKAWKPPSRAFAPSLPASRPDTSIPRRASTTTRCPRSGPSHPASVSGMVKKIFLCFRWNCASRPSVRKCTPRPGHGLNPSALSRTSP